ncbi:MAG: hypothetical protein IKN90_01775 [Treponema sp.]|jgi:hypothetical protein|nr:hypothetical protein [Treponema sp.]MBQ5448654.1 hypothetical protein [Treponema sp.]MBR3548783.1 hypothetical protein [Treponema sp.]MBR4247416.1 hypothetical protein [Treponema sp.]HBB13200.1 hypothetical protein [Treponema sp.]
MSDFAYAYFSTELDKLSLPDLEQLFEKIKGLIAKQKEVKVSQEKESITKLLDLANSLHLTSNGQSWTREELYER